MIFTLSFLFFSRYSCEGGNPFSSIFNKKNRKKVIILFLMGSLISPCFAVDVVFDPEEVAKTVSVIKRLKDQYQMLKNQYNTMKDQYHQLQQQYSAMTGNYGWGKWHNGLDELKQTRQWAAESWQSALEGLAGGNPERYQQLLEQYKQNHVVLTQAQYEKGTDKNLAAAYQSEVKTNQASAAMATYEFDDVNQHLKTLYELGQEIESVKQNQDVKSAVDLNSRIQLEVAYISIEEVRMQSLLNQQTASVQADKIAMETEAARYNQAGES